MHLHIPSESALLLVARLFTNCNGTCLWIVLVEHGKVDSKFIIDRGT